MDFSNKLSMFDKTTKKSYTVDQIKAKMEYYCAYQDRCHFEVEKKINSFFVIPEAKEEILISLIQDNFLNEERFALTFARSKFNQKKWGKLKISQELKKRNISDYLIKKGIKEIDSQDYFITIENLINKKIENTKFKNYFDLKNKVSAYMLQKGYTYSEIIEHLENHKK